MPSTSSHSRLRQGRHYPIMKFSILMTSATSLEICTSMSSAARDDNSEVTREHSNRQHFLACPLYCVFTPEYDEQDLWDVAVITRSAGPGWMVCIRFGITQDHCLYTEAISHQGLLSKHPLTLNHFLRFFTLCRPEHSSCSPCLGLRQNATFQDSAGNSQPMA